MSLLLLSLAAVTAQSVGPIASVRTASFAHRAAVGAEASATVTARIISQSARIGAGLPPPIAHMVPRKARIAAADGSLADALIYDFE